MKWTTPQDHGIVPASAPAYTQWFESIGRVKIMKLLRQKTATMFLVICLLAAAYVAARIANLRQVISYQAEDAIRLAITIVLCTTGFIRGRDFLQFTRPTPSSCSM